MFRQIPANAVHGIDDRLVVIDFAGKHAHPDAVDHATVMFFKEDLADQVFRVDFLDRLVDLVAAIVEVGMARGDGKADS